MQLETLRKMYEHDGPFATVYFEARSPAEDAEHQLDLRWDDLRHRLAESGAPDTVLDQLDDAVRAPEQTFVHASGRVLVATTDGVVFDDAFEASQGAGATLLLEYDRPATNEAELVAAAIRTGANTELIDAEVDDGVAALLRFEAAPAN